MFEKIEWIVDEALPKLSDDRITSCYLAKLYMVLADRPCTYTTSGYPNIHRYESFAKGAVEPARPKNQGTSWRIKELPTIVLTAPNCCVAIAEQTYRTPKYSFEPFRAVSDLAIGNAKLTGIVRTLAAKTNYAVGLCKTPLGPAELPFFEHYSIPKGMHRCLDWNQRPADTEIRHACDLVTYITTSIQHLTD